ncbi:hypothetical protein ASG21_07365 [Chryseobacterium sp. Leaf394]|nr:hypothetical protein ASG21_07365 [Chryseobacterium sp. Leaf394]
MSLKHCGNQHKQRNISHKLDFYQQLLRLDKYKFKKVTIPHKMINYLIKMKIFFKSQISVELNFKSFLN